MTVDVIIAVGHPVILVAKEVTGTSPRGSRTYRGNRAMHLTRREDTMPSGKLVLDYVYDHEASHPEKLLLTQPLRGGEIDHYSWERALDEARRMAAHLQRIGVGQGAHIAILSKNCAHFIIAELAIWMAGGTTVALAPAESER